MVCLILVTCTVAIAALRIGGEDGELFRSVSRFYVGFMLGMGIGIPSRVWFGSAVTLTAVEVGMILKTRLFPWLGDQKWRPPSGSMNRPGPV